MFSIEYEHQRDGVLYRGNLTGGATPATSTWSRDGGEAKELPLNEDAFSLLWNGISEFKIFQRCLVKKPDPAIDLAIHHRITAVFKEGKETGTWIYIVPATEDQDSDFARWLGALNNP